MPALIPEVLFEIGKQIIEDGDFDAVIRFALSGRQPLAILCHDFASVTTLKLSKNYYEIGWGDKCCRFNFENDEIPLKFLLHQAGNYIEILHIEDRIPIFRLYEPIIDKMIDNRQLLSFSVGNRSEKELAIALLSAFAMNLQNVVIPIEFMAPTFRAAFYLDSLTIFDSNGNRLALFCGKTSSVTFTFKEYYSNDEGYFTKNYFRHINSSLFPVKHISFVNYYFTSHDLCRNGLKEAMNYFPLLESIKYNIKFEKMDDIQKHISWYTTILENNVKVPSKIVFECHKSFFDGIRYIPYGFEVGDSFPYFNCFRKFFKSAGSKVTILELQIQK